MLWKNVSYSLRCRLPYWSNEFPKWGNGTLRKRVPLIDEEGFDLVSHLLRVSPCERFVAKHLLDHHWFDDVRAEISKRFQPWCLGLHRGYEVMVAVDRLPLARPLIEIERNQREVQEGKGKGFIATNNTISSVGLSGPSFAKGENDVNSSRVLNTSSVSNNYGFHPSSSSTENGQTSVQKNSSLESKRNDQQPLKENNIHQNTNNQNSYKNHENSESVKSSCFVNTKTNDLLSKDGIVKRQITHSESLETSQKIEVKPNNTHHDRLKTDTSTTLSSIDLSQCNYSTHNIQSHTSAKVTEQKSYEINKHYSCNNINVRPNSDSLNATQPPVDPKRTRAVARGKRSTGTAARNRRIGNTCDSRPNCIPEGTSTTNLIKSINSGTSAVTWTSVSRSRSPDRGTTRRNNRPRIIEKLPPNQSQLQFVKISGNGNDETSSLISLKSRSLSDQIDLCLGHESNAASQPVKPRRQISRTRRAGLNQVAQLQLPPPSRRTAAKCQPDGR